MNDQFEQLKAHVDIGDILGVGGSMKRTEKGNLFKDMTNFGECFASCICS